MRNECMKIIEEINSSAEAAIQADAEANQKEQEAVKRFEAAMQEKNAALDAGDSARHKAAGMAAEDARLDLEFLKGCQAKRTPNASHADDARIHAALRSEAQFVEMDALAQIRQIFTEAADVCSAALDTMTEIEKAGKRWDSVVMKKERNALDQLYADRMALSQFLNTANAQINRLALRGV